MRLSIECNLNYIVQTLAAGSGALVDAGVLLVSASICVNHIGSPDLNLCMDV